MQLLKDKTATSIPFELADDWIRLSELPSQAPDKLASVIRLELAGKPVADTTWGIDPEIATTVFAEFCTVTQAQKTKASWMEKFGEWKTLKHVHNWQKGGKATWDVTVSNHRFLIARRCPARRTFA